MIQLFMMKNKALKASMDNSLRTVMALALTAGLMFSACSSSDDEITYESDTSSYSSVAVRGFSLRLNNNVLQHLDSVFFSIDLNTAQIFNADSLPYGTDVSALGVNITTDACSSLKIFSTDSEGNETEINYIEDDDAKIDFSNGAVRLHMVSYDGEHSRDYTVKVNVHTMVPDSLFWSDMARIALPTTFSNPVQQKAVRFGDKAFCLSTDGTAYCMATSADIFNASWHKSQVSFPAPVDVRSLTATTGSLYILTEAGHLLASADGSSWRDTGSIWKSITAPYGDTLLGLEYDNGTYSHVTYPATGKTAAQADFPVSGTSAAATYTTKWAPDDQIVISGGRRADGAMTGSSWAYDGTAWACIGKSLPAAEGYAIAKYTVSETDSLRWRIKTSDVLLAFGGRSASGSINRDVYLSRDMGMTWKKGDIFLQLPEYMPSVYGADLLTFDHRMTADAAAGTLAAARGWKRSPLRTLPSVYDMAPVRSRVISQTEEWECPFLYMFGGTLEDGALQPVVWRGVVNHFTFRPLE